MHSLINYRGIQNLKLKQQPHAESTIGRLGNGLIIGEGTTMYTNHHSHRQQTTTTATATTATTTMEAKDQALLACQRTTTISLRKRKTSALEIQLN